jgi:hypothetical protein
MSCGGGHLGFPIGIKNRNLVKDIPMISLVGYSTWLPGPIICSDWLKFQRSSSLKLMNWQNPNWKRLIIGMSFTKFLFFMPIGNPRWPPPIVHLDLWSRWTNKIGIIIWVIANKQHYIVSINMQHAIIEWLNFTNFINFTIPCG